MKDLLGDPIAPTPAMDAPLPWRVYRLNDYEWWVARTLEEAQASYLVDVGPMDEEDAFEGAHELSDAAIETLIFFTDRDENESPTGKLRTFREELDLRVAAGLSAPEAFTSMEP